MMHLTISSVLDLKSKIKNLAYWFWSTAEKESKVLSAENADLCLESMRGPGQSVDHLLIVVFEWTGGDRCAHVTVCMRVRACVRACVCV